MDGRGGGAYEQDLLSKSEQYEAEEGQVGKAKPRQNLGLAKLVALIYMAVCGGAYGFEAAVRAADGPLLVLVAAFVWPVMWALPIALCVAELACALPTNAAHLGWVNTVFPPGWTCTIACWTCIINVVDNALYPNMLVSYLESRAGELEWYNAVAVKFAVVFTTMGFNIIGIDSVGNLLVALSMAAAVPFFMIFAFGIGDIDFSLLGGPIEFDKIKWSLFFSILTWNFSGYDSAGHVAEEIKDPGRNFSRAMWISLWLPTLTYVLPVLPGVAVASDYSKWEDGYWPVIADRVAGEWLSIVLMVGGCVTAYAYMLTYTCTTSRAFQLTCGLGIGPKFAKKTIGTVSHRTGTPIYAIVIMSSLALFCSTLFDFEGLVIVDSTIYCAKVLLMVASFFRLRSQYPDLPRPYRVPGSTPVLYLIFIPPVLLSATSVVVGATNDLATSLICAGSLLVTAALSFAYTHYFKPEGYQIDEIDEILAASPGRKMVDGQSEPGDIPPEPQAWEPNPEGETDEF